MYGQKRVIHYRLLLLSLNHSRTFYRIDRSTNKKYLCDSNFEKRFGGSNFVMYEKVFNGIIPIL